MLCPVIFICSLLAECFKLAVPPSMTHNILQLQEVGDFDVQNGLQTLILIQSKKLHLTKEPPIACRCCYAFVLSL